MPRAPSGARSCLAASEHTLVTFLGTLGGLESPATEGCVLEGRSGSPDTRGGRALEHKEGWVRRGPMRETGRESNVGLLPPCLVPTVF